MTDDFENIVILSTVTTDQYIGVKDENAADGYTVLQNAMMIEVSYNEVTEKPSVLFYPIHPLSDDDTLILQDIHILYPCTPKSYVLEFYKKSIAKKKLIQDIKNASSEEEAKDDIYTMILNNMDGTETLN
jgi:hypothetical protein